MPPFSHFPATRENYANSIHSRYPYPQPATTNTIPANFQTQPMEHSSMVGHQMSDGGISNPHFNGILPGQNGAYNPLVRHPMVFESQPVGASGLATSLPSGGPVSPRVQFAAPVTIPAVPTSVSNLGQLYMLTNSANGIGIQPVTINTPARKPGKHRSILFRVTQFG